MASADFEPDLVPELLVTDVAESIRFWCGLCGYAIAYERPEEGFAYMTQGNAHIMLEQRGLGRNWTTAEFAPPFGRGINFQIGVPDLESILAALSGSARPLFMPPEIKWNRVSAGEEAGVRQFLVTDPDGYLIRFQSPLGRRTVQASASLGTGRIRARAPGSSNDRGVSADHLRPRVAPA